MAQKTDRDRSAERGLVGGKHQDNAAPLPRSHTITTALPAVSANITAQVYSDQMGCRITVGGVNAQIFCLAKSA